MLEQPSTSISLRWQSGSCYQYWRLWDAENFILFDARSAQTHQLNPLAADILSLLKDQPLDFVELRERLIALYENLEFDAEVSAYLQETLDLLDELGLIEPELM